MNQPVLLNNRYKLPFLKNPLPRILKFRKILDYLDIIDKKNGTVIDYGSGDMPYKDMLTKYFGKYISADFEPSNKLHSKLPDLLIKSNQSINIESDSIDCVFLTEVLEHIYDPKKALKEINRILSSKGYVIGSVPFFQGEHEIPYDYYRYTFYSLKNIFIESGFEIIRLEYIGDLLAVQIAVYARFYSIILKSLNKIKLGFISAILNLVLKLPELFYFQLYKLNVFPLKIKLLSTFPLGFTFLLRKKGID